MKNFFSLIFGLLLLLTPATLYASHGTTSTSNPCPILALTGHGEVVTSNGSTRLLDFFATHPQFGLTTTSFATNFTMSQIMNFHAVLAIDPGFFGGVNYSNQELGLLNAYVASGGTLVVSAEADFSPFGGNPLTRIHPETLLQQFDNSLTLGTVFGPYLTTIVNTTHPFVSGVTTFEMNDDAVLATHNNLWNVIARSPTSVTTPASMAFKPALAVRSLGSGKVVYGIGELGDPDAVSNPAPHITILENILNSAC